MSYLKIILAVSVSAATFMLTGCQTAAMSHQFNQQISSVAGQADQYLDGKAMSGVTPDVVVRPGFYANATPVSINKQPAWLRTSVSLQAKALPLDELMKQLLPHHNLSVVFGNGVAANRSVTLDYTGRVQGALDQIAKATGYYYTTARNSVFWSNFETKTFNIAFMPGNINYNLGNSKSQTTTENSGISDSQTSTFSGSLSLWKDLTKTLQAFKSPDGKVYVSQATTSVTVHDHPANVRMMAHYISNMNKLLSEQVTIKVKVLNVDLNNQFANGINWSMVGKVLGKSVKLAGNPMQGITSSLADSSSLDSMSSVTVGTNNKTIIQALQQQGRVSMVTEPQVTTLNNQVASIGITRQQGYLQNISTTTTGSGADSNVSMSLTPGNVTTGFTMYILPKIRGNKVYLQLFSNMASMVQLQSINGEGTAPVADTASGADATKEAIQVPTVDTKKFNQRSVVKNGQTLIVAGFNSLNNNTSKSKMFSMSALGARSGEHRKEQTIVLITPIITRK